MQFSHVKTCFILFFFQAIDSFTHPTLTAPIFCADRLRPSQSPCPNALCEHAPPRPSCRSLFLPPLGTLALRAAHSLGCVGVVKSPRCVHFLLHGAGGSTSPNVPPLYMVR